jgi:hypothetical protein
MHRLFACIICLVMALILPRTSAQDDMPPADYVIEGENITEFQWLPDGSGLRVIDEIVPGEQRIEFVYDLETQSAQPSSDILENEGASEATSSIVYLSPNKRWAIYGITENEQSYLVIRDLITDQPHVMYDAPMIIIANTRFFKVWWSEDSSAFHTYSSDGSATAWYYVSHFAHAWEDTSVFNLYENRSLVQAGIGFVADISDIDARGDTLLIRRNTHSESSATISQLVTLNMKTLTYEILVSETRGVAGASFGQSNNVYYVSRDGLFVYDFTSGTSQLINPEINSEWTLNVEISPDGRYIAVMKGDDNLYIIPVIP